MKSYFYSYFQMTVVMSGDEYAKYERILDDMINYYEVVNRMINEVKKVRYETINECHDSIKEHAKTYNIGCISYSDFYGTLIDMNKDDYIYPDSVTDYEQIILKECRKKCDIYNTTMDKIDEDYDEWIKYLLSNADSLVNVIKFDIKPYVIDYIRRENTGDVIRCVYNTIRDNNSVLYNKITTLNAIINKFDNGNDPVNEWIYSIYDHYQSIKRCANDPLCSV